MNRLSIENSFTWAQRFVAREWGLLLPVALAFIAFPPLVLALALPQELQQALLTVPIKDPARVQAALVWLLPLAFVIAAAGGIGGLAVTALALTARMSVGEAIAHAVRRLPVLIGSVAILALGLLFFAIVDVTVLALTGLDQARMQVIAITCMFVAAGALLVRMSPLLAVIADRRIGPISAIGETWRLGRGVAWKMLLVLMIYYLATMIVMLALDKALGACILLGARLGGWPDLAAPLLAVVDRILGGIVTAGSNILGVAFYWQLSNKGKA